MTRWSALLFLAVSGCTVQAGTSPEAPAETRPEVEPPLPAAAQAEAQPEGMEPAAANPPGAAQAQDPSAPMSATAQAPLLEDTSQLSAATQAYAAELKRTLERARQTTLAELETEFAPALKSDLPYDPQAAQHLDLIQSSKLQLDTLELGALGKQGFALSSRQRFPTFAYGYATIYAEDLPVYISADSILDTVHRSYDKLLAAIERQLLIAELSTLLSHLLSAADALPESATQADLVTYLAVADALLHGTPPIAGNSEAVEIVDLAKKAQGTATFTLFGVPRNEDMSQFLPRGHYAEDPELQKYFRAMMWLGRVDFRLVETLPTGGQVAHRTQIEAMLLLGELQSADDRALFEHMESILRVFVGESDNMTLAQLPALRTALGITKSSELAALSDDQLKQVILTQGFGKQQISSHLLQGGFESPTPMAASFLLFGQRYVVDSHVMSNVTWDRTRAMRMMPDALDVAFAALGNGQAITLLHDQLTKYPYAGDLNGVRALIDSHDQSFWNSSLYNAWLSALRTLAPKPNVVADPLAHGSPSVVATEAWGRRMLNTQLASWAQLRHDTLLYVKQSYTSAAVCEFPDAAVEPYPEFFAALASYADRASVIVPLIQKATDLASGLDAYLRRLRDAAVHLQGIAEAQRAHKPLTDAQLAFINDAVVIKKEAVGCTSVDIASGWYTQLFFGSDPLAFDPTIADVHTQPTDEVGTPVGRVLHVGSGQPMLMVVTLDGCSAGPRAYVGLASSYHERLTENFKRLTDKEWAEEVKNGRPLAPSWMTDLTQRL